jgi:hypothetical protein
LQRGSVPPGWQFVDVLLHRLARCRRWRGFRRPNGLRDIVHRRNLLILFVHRWLSVGAEHQAQAIDGKHGVSDQVTVTRDCNALMAALLRIGLAEMKFAEMKFAEMEFAEMELAGMELAGMELAGMELAEMELAEMELAEMELAVCLFVHYSRQ